MDIDRRTIIEPQKIKELISSGLDKYVTNMELRNAVGPVLDFGLMSLVNLFHQERLSGYFTILFDEMNSLQANKVDKEFLKSDEFIDYLLRTSDNSLKTRHRERIRLNCKILVGSMSLENINQRHSAEDFLSLVSDLTPNDILLGLNIYEQQKSRPKQFGFESKYKNTELDFAIDSGWHKLQETCRLDDVDFQTSLLKLSRAGLIKEIVGMYSNYVGDRYTITPTFQRLMSFIRLRTNDPLFSTTIRDP